VEHPTKGELVNKRTYKAIVLLIVVLSLVTSACFQIRFLRMTPDQLAMGDKGLVRVEQYRISATNGGGVTTPFLLIGFDEASLKLKTVSQFDMFSNFGGPFDRVNDTDLRDLLRTTGNCTFNGLDAADITGMKWRAYRTVGTVDLSSGGFGDIFRVKLALERIGGNDSSRGDFLIFTGSWLDVVGNDIPETGEVACFSAFMSSFAFKP